VLTLACNQWVIADFPKENLAFARTLLGLIYEQVRVTLRVTRDPSLRVLRQVGTRLSTVDWLDDETRAAAMEKWQGATAREERTHHSPALMRGSHGRRHCKERGLQRPVGADGRSRGRGLGVRQCVLSERSAERLTHSCWQTTWRAARGVPACRLPSTAPRTTATSWTRTRETLRGLLLSPFCSASRRSARPRARATHMYRYYIQNAFYEPTANR
jgi:hypothetical protein